MSDAKVHISAGNELHGAVVETDSYIVNISRQYARIYSYDDYLVSAGVVAPTAQPTSLTFSNVTTTTMDVSFTASVGGADGYVAFRRTGTSPTFVPVDGTTYTVGNTYGDSTCQHFGAGVTFSETGLSASTTYYYDFFAWNGAVGTYVFLTTSPLEGSQITAFAFSNALRFDGSNDRVDNTAAMKAFGAGSPCLTNFICSFWTKPDNAGATLRRIYSETNSGQTQGIEILQRTATQIEVTFNGSSNYMRFSVSASVWNHVTILFDGSQSGNTTRAVALVNGAGVTETYGGTIPSSITATTGGSRLGAFSGGTANNFLDAVIDEFCIWSDNDISHGSNHYGSGSGAVPDSTNLYRYWPFNESNSSSTTSEQITGENSTLVNFNYDSNSGFESH